MKHFILEDFLTDLDNKLSTYSIKLSDEKDVNQDVLNLTSILKKIDKHAPMRPMSRKEKRLNEKPWITRGILTSIKTKNRFFKKYY